jgi:hypothetical protein
MRVSPVERCLIIVARDQPDLLAQLAFMYAHEANVEVCFDRRQGQRWNGLGDPPDRRYAPRPDTDLRSHGFIVIPRP